MQELTKVLNKKRTIKKECKACGIEYVKYGEIKLEFGYEHRNDPIKFYKDKIAETQKIIDSQKAWHLVNNQLLAGDKEDQPEKDIDKLVADFRNNSCKGNGNPLQKDEKVWLSDSEEEEEEGAKKNDFASLMKKLKEENAKKDGDSSRIWATDTEEEEEVDAKNEATISQTKEQPTADFNFWEDYGIEADFEKEDKPKLIPPRRSKEFSFVWADDNDDQEGEQEDKGKEDQTATVERLTRTGERRKRVLDGRRKLITDALITKENRTETT